MIKFIELVIGLVFLVTGLFLMIGSIICWVITSLPFIITGYEFDSMFILLGFFMTVIGTYVLNRSALRD